MMLSNFNKFFLVTVAVAMTAVLVQGQAENCITMGTGEYSSIISAAATNCSASTTTSTSCTIDYADFPASNTLEAQCAAANLTLATTSFSMTCGSTTVTQENVPYCLSEACSVDALSDYENDLTEAINDGFSNVGISCSTTATVSAAEKTQLFLAGLVGAAFAFVMA